MVEAQYFVIQVVSADPTKWADNPVAETIDFEATGINPNYAG